jgi:hypothetical protein
MSAKIQKTIVVLDNGVEIHLPNNKIVKDIKQVYSPESLKVFLSFEVEDEI